MAETKVSVSDDTEVKVVKKVKKKPVEVKEEGATSEQINKLIESLNQ